MKLYIRFGSLFKFQSVYDRNAYLQKQLTRESPSSWFIEDGTDMKEIERVLNGNRINYCIKNYD